MRLAGRYLRKYKATVIKAGSKLRGLATKLQYSTYVTLQPLDRYAVYVAIL